MPAPTYVIMLVHRLIGYQIMDANTTLSHRFITGHIYQINALEEPGETSSHPKAELESTVGYRLSGHTSLI